MVMNSVTTNFSTSSQNTTRIMQFMISILALDINFHNIIDKFRFRSYGVHDVKILS
jgi:hypothetical protein